LEQSNYITHQQADEILCQLRMVPSNNTPAFYHYLQELVSS